MTTLLFARHGQASFGQQNYDKLSEIGAKQAWLLGQHYANCQRPIDGLITGSLSRQRDSAKHFLQGYESSSEASQALALALPSVEPKIIEGLNEFNHEDVFVKSNPKFATHEGILAEIGQAPEPKLRLAELFNQAMQRWHSGDFDEDYEESWPQFNERVKQTLHEIIAHVQARASKNNPASAETYLIFTSGGVISALAAHLLGQGQQTAYQLSRTLVNAGVTTITLKDTQPRLLALNEYSHLFHQGDSYLTWH